jgi:hypothetical protein
MKHPDPIFVAIGVVMVLMAASLVWMYWTGKLLIRL